MPLAVSFLKLPLRSPPPNNLTRLRSLRRSGQVLVPICRDQDVVFDPDAADGIVFAQHGAVDVFAVLGVV